MKLVYPSRMMQTDKSECLTLPSFFQDILSEGKPTLLEQLSKVGSLHYPQILDQCGKVGAGGTRRPPSRRHVISSTLSTGRQG
jgi:hypothetical protein